MTGWQTATVECVERVNDELCSLVLTVPEALAKTFDTPGQYHRLSLDGVASSYFALASAPGATRFEYLIKRGAAVADRLTELRPGATLHASNLHGGGFPLALAHQRPLLLIGVGAAFAPLRSVLLTIGARGRGFPRVDVLWGVRSAAHLAWPRDLEAWRAAGHQVRVTVSQPEASWRGLTGRVQQHLEVLDVDDAVAFVAGQRELVVDLKALLAKRGLAVERVFTNH